MMDERRLSVPDTILQSLRDPRSAARHILGLDLPAAVLWQALALVIVLSALGMQVALMLAGPPDPEAGAPMMPGAMFSPLTLAMVQGCLLVIMVFAVHWVGRAFGGTGSFEGALAVVAWLQFLLVCFQVVQVVAAVILPPLAGLLGIVGLGVFFWLLTLFLCELHGFRSPAMVFVMIVVTMLALVFALSIVLAIILVPMTGGLPDV